MVQGAGHARITTTTNYHHRGDCLMKKSLFAAALAAPLAVASLALAQSPTPAPRPTTPPSAQPPQAEKLTEAEIRQGLETKGYTDVRTVQSNGDEYQVEAKKDGRPVMLVVNARTGRYNERAS
jgi:hypothetical protein